MLLSLSGNRAAGASVAGTDPLGIKDQETKVSLNFAMVSHEGKAGQLIQPSRNIPKAMEAWNIWKLTEITADSGTTLSRVISCMEASNLKVTPQFYSSTVGTAKILVSGTTFGGTVTPIDLLFLDVTSGSLPVGTGVFVDGGPAGMVEVMSYLMKPINVNIAGLVSVQLSVLVATGTLDISLGVS